MKSRWIFLSCALLSFSLISRGQEWKTLSDSAKFYNDQRNYQAAIANYKKALEKLPSDSSNSVTQIRLNTSLGQIYLITGNYKASINSLDFAINASNASVIKDTLLYTTAIDLKGQSQFSLGEYEEAEKLWIELTNLLEKSKGKSSPAYARGCNLLGTVYLTVGKYAEAEFYLLQAVSIREEFPGKDSVDYAQSVNNLSNVYRDIGQFEKAEPLAIKAKEIRARLPQPNAQYAISCINLGNLYRELGQYELAESLYLEGKQLRKEIYNDKHPQYALVCNVLADLYLLMGKSKDAEELYLEALEIRRGKYLVDYAQSCNNLANLYFDQRQYEKAEKLYLEAKEIWNQELDSTNSAHAFNRTSLGKLYLVTGRLKEAEENLNEAKALWASTMGKDHPNYTWSTRELAKLYWNENRIAQADAMYGETFNLQKDQLNKVFRFTSEKEKQQYLQNVKGAADEYLSFYFRKFPASNAGKAYTMNLLDRNLILSSTTQLRENIYNSSDKEAIKDFEKWLALRQKLAAFYARPNFQKDEEIAKLEDEANKLEKDLSKRSTTFSQDQPSDLNWEQLKKKLGTNEAAIEFIEFNLFNGREWTDSTVYAAMLIKKDLPAPRMIYLFEKRQLDSILSNISESNVAILYRGGKESKVAHASYSKLIYQSVWQPLEAYLKNINKVYFAPAGDLFKISFAAIPINETSLLSDKYQLVQLNTTAAILNNKVSVLGSDDQLVLYGGINYDTNPETIAKTVPAQNKTYKKTRSARTGNTSTSFEYLVGTLTEVNGLQKQAAAAKFKTKVFTNLNATEESFKSISAANSPAILHIATHGFFYSNLDSSSNIFSSSKDPLMRSGLLFAGANNSFQGKMPDNLEDGILTAYEVSNMYLPKTRLVVLSACETARGDIQGSEGVYGLQRAFKMAGVQNLVMSLWEVPDTETAEFMQEFYKNIFKKLPVSDAFYKAQTTMKNKYRKEPEKWAAWVLVR